jgi:hypothetical protein
MYKHNTRNVQASLIAYTLKLFIKMEAVLHYSRVLLHI